MNTYMRRAIKAVYLPMTIVLLVLLELGVFFIHRGRLAEAEAHHYALLETYIAGRVDMLEQDPTTAALSMLATEGFDTFAGMFRTGGTIIVDASGDEPLAIRLCTDFTGKSDNAGRYAQFDPIQRAINGYRGRWKGISLSGDAVLAAYAGIPGHRTGIYASVSYKEVSRPVNRQTGILALGAIALSAGIFLAATTIGSRFRHMAAHSEDSILATNVTEQIVEGIAITDEKGTIRSVNKAFTKITGWQAEEAVGRNPRILKSDRHDNSFYESMWGSLKNQGAWAGEIWNRKRDGTVYPEWLSITAIRSNGGKNRGYVSVFLDLTELKNRDAAITQLTARDPLTGLPNRALMSDRLLTSIRQGERERESIAVMYLDLSNFKYINTSYGYAMGDTVLQTLAHKLEATLRKGDTISRLSADDFVAVLPRLHREEDALNIAETLLRTVRLPMTIEGRELYLDGSVGISFYPENGDDPDTLIGAANAALNQAKESGPGSLRVYTPALNDRVMKRLSLESRLRKAIERESFAVYYQPRVETRTRRVESMEALVRWIDEDGTVIAPGVFIPLAEENGMILPIGEWVLNRALADLAIWQKKDPLLRVSVNLSARQFRLPDLASRVDAMLGANGVEPTTLELELTESLAMSDVSTSVSIMTKLNERGISLSLDDFGTGYSSLYYLKRLPIQWLKIDQSFVRDYRSPDDSPANAIVNTIIEMSRSLGLGTIAEGCETDEQFGFLQRRQCDQVQGYLFSPPLPAKDFDRFVGTSV